VVGSWHLSLLRVTGCVIATASIGSVPPQLLLLSRLGVI
jgi:hypothetical protein